MSDLVTINAELFDEEIYIENTPVGYAVFSGDRDGQMLSAPYDSENCARAFKAGWEAAMASIEESV